MSKGKGMEREETDNTPQKKPKKRKEKKS